MSPPTTPPAEPRRSRWPLSDLPREVPILVGVNFLVAVGFGIVAPALPLFAKEFGVGNLAAGAVISVFALMRFVSALGAGRLADRIGERLVLGIGIGIVAVSSLLAGLAQSYTQLVVLRGAGGVGSAMFTVSSVALLLRVVAPDQRARAAGAATAGFLVGGITGPAFGGPLAAWSLRAPFFVYAFTLTLAGTLALVALRHSSLRALEQARTEAEPMPLKTAFRSRAYQAAIANNFFNGWALFGLRVSLVPVYVVEGLKLGAQWTGWGLLVSAAVQAVLLLPAGRLADSRGRKPFLLLGACLSLASMVLLAAVETPPAYLLSMALFGAGSAFIGTAGSGVVGDVIHGRGGKPVAAFQMASDAGAFIGPLVGGLLADDYSFAVAFGATAAIAAVAVGAVAVMPETLPRRRAQQAETAGG